MSEKVLSSGSYLLCSGEKRFHRKQDVGGRRDSVSLADQNTWLKRRVNLARLIAKNLVADYGEFVTIYIMSYSQTKGTSRIAFKEQ